LAGNGGLKLHRFEWVATLCAKISHDHAFEEAVLAVDVLRRRYTRCAAFFALATVGALWIDMPVARWADNDGFRRLGDFDNLVVWSEFFAHGLGVSLILLLVLVLDPENRRRVLRLGFLSLGSGAMASLVKIFINRTRPYSANLTDTSLATFQGLFPVSHEFKSLPSGHSATAVGLAIGLAFLYPRGRWLFFAFAAIASSQRWANRDHFVSDSLAGAALACLIAAVVLGKSPIERWLSEFEAAEVKNEEGAADEEMSEAEGAGPVELIVGRDLIRPRESREYLKAS
jgi:membrane-associated phospholipid phosphatase